MLSPRLLHEPRRKAHGTRPIVPNALNAARTHLLKPHDQHAIHGTISHQRSGEMQTRGAGRAGVVGVVDGNGRHAELVHDALAGGGVPVAVACHAGLDVVVVYLGVEHGFHAGFEAEFWVGALLAWFDEGGQADAEDVGVGL